MECSRLWRQDVQRSCGTDNGDVLEAQRERLYGWDSRMEAGWSGFTLLLCV